MGETLRMSGPERERLDAMKRVERSEISLLAASLQLGLSYRQAKRILSRFRVEGDAGVLHRSRGRPSNRRLPAEIRDRALEVYRDQLTGFGPTLASELLAERWDVHVGQETLRRWLIADGQWRTRRRTQKHRRRRARKSHFGEMIQLDGSYHDWLGRGELDCLLGMIDDATNRRMTRMSSEETTADGLELLLAWVRRYGIPQSLYVDRKSVYWTDRAPTIKESLAGTDPATAFGRVCQRLGIRIIFANSPQAKGRIERCHAVYQDRLVKLIGLDGLKDHNQVNLLLESLDEKLNQKFSLPAADSVDVHRPIPRDLDLSDAFAQEYTRVINNDWTFRFENRWFQITGPKTSLPPAKGRVQVLRRLDRSLYVLYRGQPVQFDELEERPPKQQPREPDTASKPKSRKPPAIDHPWRRPFSRNAPSFTRD
jgi:hypothetical protein